jgi:hypothetical protein
VIQGSNEEGLGARGQDEIRMEPSTEKIEVSGGHKQYEFDDRYLYLES